MLRRKARKKSKGKKLEKLEEKVSSADESSLQKTDLPNQIRKVAEGLYYVSETDAQILPFVGQKALTVDRDIILIQSKNAADSPVEERDFDDFFARLTEIQDWFGDEENDTARKFVQLKNLLQSNLRDLKVFKVGKIQLDVYAVGLNAENTLLGIQTKAVET